MAEDFEAEDFEIKDYSFTPEVYEKNGLTVIDYTKVEHNQIYLVNKKDILTKPRPDWIPELDEDGLFADSYLPTCAKDSDGTFYVLSKKITGKEILKINGRNGQQNTYESKYYRMSLDLLSATIDYYIKRRRETLRSGSYDTKTVRLPSSQKSMSIERYYGIADLTRLCDRYKDEADIISKRYTRRNEPGSERQNEVVFREQYVPLLEEIKDKRFDLNLQKTSFIESHAKGNETAYGDTNLSDTLKDSHGLRIKKQNGSSFDSQQIERLEAALNSTFGFYGNLKNLLDSNNVKISYADNCYQYCSKSTGVWSEYNNCLGVSFFDDKMQEKLGGKICTPDISMVHEFAHWLDSLKGKELKYHYASDKEETPENHIAKLYKKLVKEKNSKKSSIGGSEKTKKLGEYWYRTCECFARAMEQTYAYRHGIDMDVEPGYLSEEVFVKNILPLTKNLIEENRKHFNLEENVQQTVNIPDAAASSSAVKEELPVDKSVTEKPYEIHDIEGTKKVYKMWGSNELTQFLDNLNPDSKTISDFNKWLKEHKEDYIRLYHGTALSNDEDIRKNGIKKTTSNRRKSYQSTSGFVYLSRFPDMAKTFGDMNNMSGKTIVYACDLKIKELKADLDQLNNKRSVGIDSDNSLAASLLIGNGARIDRVIKNYEISPVIFNDISVGEDLDMKEENKIPHSAENNADKNSLYPDLTETCKDSDSMLRELKKLGDVKVSLNPVDLYIEFRNKNDPYINVSDTVNYVRINYGLHKRYGSVDLDNVSKTMANNLLQYFVLLEEEGKLPERKKYILKSPGYGLPMIQSNDLSELKEIIYNQIKECSKSKRGFSFQIENFAVEDDIFGDERSYLTNCIYGVANHPNGTVEVYEEGIGLKEYNSSQDFLDSLEYANDLFTDSPELKTDFTEEELSYNGEMKDYSNSPVINSNGLRLDFNYTIPKEKAALFGVNHPIVVNGGVNEYSSFIGTDYKTRKDPDFNLEQFKVYAHKIIDKARTEFIERTKNLDSQEKIMEKKTGIENNTIELKWRIISNNKEAFEITNEKGEPVSYTRELGAINEKGEPGFMLYRNGKLELDYLLPEDTCNARVVWHLAEIEAYKSYADEIGESYDVAEDIFYDLDKYDRNDRVDGELRKLLNDVIIYPKRTFYNIKTYPLYEAVKHHLMKNGTIPLDTKEFPSFDELKAKGSDFPVLEITDRTYVFDEESKTFGIINKNGIKFVNPKELPAKVYNSYHEEVDVTEYKNSELELEYSGPYVAPGSQIKAMSYYNSKGTRELCHAVKELDRGSDEYKAAIEKMADYISNKIVKSNSTYLIPAPNHSGNAEYTYDLARAVALKTGATLFDCLKCEPHETLYQQKKNGEDPSVKLYLTEEGKAWVERTKDKKQFVYLVDNNISTGITFNNASYLIPGLIPAVYAIGNFAEINYEEGRFHVVNTKDRENTNLHEYDGIWNKTVGVLDRTGICYANSDELSSVNYIIQINEEITKELIGKHIEHTSAEDINLDEYLKDGVVSVIEYRNPLTTLASKQFLLGKYDLKEKRIIDEKEIEPDSYLVNEIKIICDSYDKMNPGWWQCKKLDEVSPDLYDVVLQNVDTGKYIYIQNSDYECWDATYYDENKKELDIGVGEDIDNTEGADIVEAAKSFIEFFEPGSDVSKWLAFPETEYFLDQADKISNKRLKEIENSSINRMFEETSERKNKNVSNDSQWILEAPNGTLAKYVATDEVERINEFRKYASENFINGESYFPQMWILGHIWNQNNILGFEKSLKDDRFAMEEIKNFVSETKSFPKYVLSTYSKNEGNIIDVGKTYWSYIPGNFDELVKQARTLMAEKKVEGAYIESIPNFIENHALYTDYQIEISDKKTKSISESFRLEEYTGNRYNEYKSASALKKFLKTPENTVTEEKDFVPSSKELLPSVDFANELSFSKEGLKSYVLFYRTFDKDNYMLSADSLDNLRKLSEELTLNRIAESVRVVKKLGPDWTDSNEYTNNIKNDEYFIFTSSKKDKNDSEYKLKIYDRRLKYWTEYPLDKCREYFDRRREETKGMERIDYPMLEWDKKVLSDFGFKPVDEKNEKESIFVLENWNNNDVNIEISKTRLENTSQYFYDYTVMLSDGSVILAEKKDLKDVPGCLIDICKEIYSGCLSGEALDKKGYDMYFKESVINPENIAKQLFTSEKRFYLDKEKDQNLDDFTKDLIAAIHSVNDSYLLGLSKSDSGYIKTVAPAKAEELYEISKTGADYRKAIDSLFKDITEIKGNESKKESAKKDIIVNLMSYNDFINRSGLFSDGYKFPENIKNLVGYNTAWDSAKDIKISELKDLYKTLNDDMKHLEKKYLVEAKEREEFYKTHNSEKEETKETNMKEITEQQKKDSEILHELYGSKKAIDSACKKISIKDFCSSDQTRYFMTGIYYEKGFAIATDGRVLIKLKTDYPAKYEGKIIDPNNGREIEGHFPAYERVFPAKDGLVDRSDRLAHLNNYLSSAVAAETVKNKKHDMFIEFDNTLVNSRYLLMALSFVKDKGFSKCLQEDNYEFKTTDVLDEKGEPVYKFHISGEYEEGTSNYKYYTYEELPEELKKVVGKEIETKKYDSFDIPGSINRLYWDKVVTSVKVPLEDKTKLLNRCVEFDSPDGSSVLIMPSNSLKEEVQYIDRDGIIHNYEEDSKIRSKLLGKGKDLYKNTSKLLVESTGYPSEDFDALFDKNYEIAVGKKDLPGFPSDEKEFLLYAAATTYGDCALKALFAEGKTLAEGVTEQDVKEHIGEQFLYDYLRDNIKNPEKIFIGSIANGGLSVTDRFIDGLLVDSPKPENTVEQPSPTTVEASPSEKKEEKSFSFFVKDTAEFGADMEPVTGLTATQAVEKFLELEKKGLSCGIGIHIPDNFVFNDPDGNGAYVFNKFHGEEYSFFVGDNFVKELRSWHDGDEDILKAFEALENAVEASEIGKSDNYKKPDFIAEKRMEFSDKQLFIETYYPNYSQSDTIAFDNDLASFIDGQLSDVNTIEEFNERYYMNFKSEEEMKEYAANLDEAIYRAAIACKFNSSGKELMLEQAAHLEPGDKVYDEFELVHDPDLLKKEHKEEAVEQTVSASEEKTPDGEKLEDILDYLDIHVVALKKDDYLLMDKDTEEYLFSNKHFASAKEIFEALEDRIENYIVKDMEEALDVTSGGKDVDSALDELCGIWEEELDDDERAEELGEEYGSLKSYAESILDPESVVMPETQKIRTVTFQEILSEAHCSMKITDDYSIIIHNDELDAYMDEEGHFTIDNESDAYKYKAEDYMDVIDCLDIDLESFFNDMTEQLREVGAELASAEPWEEIANRYRTELDKQGDSYLSWYDLSIAEAVFNPENIIFPDISAIKARGFLNDKNVEVGVEEKPSVENEIDTEDQIETVAFKIDSVSKEDWEELKEHLVQNNYRPKVIYEPDYSDSETGTAVFSVDEDISVETKTIMEDRNIDFTLIETENELKLSAGTELTLSLSSLYEELSGKDSPFVLDNKNVVYTKSGYSLEASELDKEKESGAGYFDLYSEDGTLVCCDGETVVFRYYDKEKELYMFENDSAEKNVLFGLSKEELDVAAFNHIRSVNIENKTEQSKNVYTNNADIANEANDKARKLGYYFSYNSDDPDFEVCEIYRDSDGAWLAEYGEGGFAYPDGVDEDMKISDDVLKEVISLAEIFYDSVKQDLHNEVSEDISEKEEIKEEVKTEMSSNLTLKDFDHEKFFELYSKAYNKYYNSRSKNTEELESVNCDKFNFLLKYSKDFKDTVISFVQNERKHDPFSSDRECAAVVDAFNTMGVDISLKPNELAECLIQNCYELQLESGNPIHEYGLTVSRMAEITGVKPDVIKNNITEIMKSFNDSSNYILKDVVSNTSLDDNDKDIIKLRFTDSEFVKKNDFGLYVHKSLAELEDEGILDFKGGEGAPDNYSIAELEKDFENIGMYKEFLQCVFSVYNGGLRDGDFHGDDYRSLEEGIARFAEKYVDDHGIQALYDWLDEHDDVNVDSVISNDDYGNILESLTTIYESLGIEIASRDTILSPRYSLQDAFEDELKVNDEVRKYQHLFKEGVLPFDPELFPKRLAVMNKGEEIKKDLAEDISKIVSETVGAKVEEPVAVNPSAINLDDGTYTAEELENIVMGDIREMISEFDTDGNIIPIAVKLYGNPEKEDDIRFLLEFDSRDGTQREDDLFNALSETMSESDDEYGIGEKGWDINPITADKSGTIDRYLIELSENGILKEGELGYVPEEERKEKKEIAIKEMNEKIDFLTEEKTYLFPEGFFKNSNELDEYDVIYEGSFKYPTDGVCQVVTGTGRELRNIAEDYGYELHPDFIYNKDELARDVAEPVKDLKFRAKDIAAGFGETMKNNPNVTVTVVPKTEPEKKSVAAETVTLKNLIDNVTNVAVGRELEQAGFEELKDGSYKLDGVKIAMSYDKNNKICINFVRPDGKSAMYVHEEYKDKSIINALDSLLKKGFLSERNCPNLVSSVELARKGLLDMDNPSLEINTESKSGNSFDIGVAPSGDTYSVKITGQIPSELRTDLMNSGFRYSTLAKAWKAVINQNTSESLLELVTLYEPNKVAETKEKINEISNGNFVVREPTVSEVQKGRLTVDNIADVIKKTAAEHPEFKNDYTMVLSNMLMNSNDSDREVIMKTFAGCNGQEAVSKRLDELINGKKPGSYTHERKYDDTDLGR